MKRLIFINRFFYPDISATSQILFDLTKRLAAEGYDVHVICSRQRYDDANANLRGQEQVEGVSVHRVRTTRFGRRHLKGRAVDYASFYFAAGAKLLTLARADDVVIAKTDPPLISVPAAVVAKLRRAQLINWLQDVFPEVASQLDSNPLPLWLDAAVRRLRDWSLRAARTNVVLGSRMREHFIKCGIPVEQIRIIENWADDNAIQPKPVEESILRSQFDLQGKFVVGYSGNMGRAHDFETILGAAQRLVKERDIVFLMIGGGVKMDALRNEVLGRGLANFIFLPYQERDTLAHSLAAADVHLACLLPSLEGLIVPSKFYGILAAERPVIFIGDVDGELARTISTADCGTTVRQGDSDALVSEIWRLSRDSAYRQKLARNSRVAFAKAFTMEHGAKKWLDLLPGAREPSRGRKVEHAETEEAQLPAPVLQRGTR